MDSKVITGEVRLSYEHITTPQKNDSGDDVYSVSLLIPKTDTKTIEAIKAAIKVAAEEGKAKFGGIIPKGLKNPLHDGDAEKDNPEYQGHMYINATSYSKPAVIDLQGRPLILPSDIYSGCFARAIITLKAYNSEKAKTKGIRCQLDAVQKLRDGDPFGGSVGMSAEAAASAFGVAPASQDDGDMPDWI